MSVSRASSKADGRWAVVTLETRAGSAEALAGRARAAFGVEPVQLLRPDSDRAWVELYFDNSAAALLAARAGAGWPGVAGTAVRDVAPRAWQRFWRRHFHARAIGKRLAILPAWERRRRALRGRAVVRVEPGLSFGTGDHFTTRYCLEAIERLCRSKPPASLLDVGCGSGILAIAAAKLGVRRVVAFDHDPQAVAQARKNLRLNRVTPRVRLRVGDALGPPPRRPFEVVCANLFGGLLIRAAEALCAAAKWRIVLSGLRETEADAVIRAFLRRGAREIERDGDGEWCGAMLAVDNTAHNRGITPVAVDSDLAEE